MKKKNLTNEQVNKIIDYEKYNFKLKIVKRFTSIPVLTFVGFIAVLFKSPEQIEKVISVVFDNMVSSIYLSVSVAVNIVLVTILLAKNTTINNQKIRLSDKRKDLEINDAYNSSSGLNKQGVSKYDRQ